MRYIHSLVAAVLLFTASPLIAQQARLQVIHNAADPAASVVDIYVNGALFLDNFAFRAATPFVNVPAGVPLSIGIAPGSSSSVLDAIATFTPTFDANKTYVAVANGVLSPPSFAANPDSRSTAFTLFVTDMGRETGSSPTNVDINVLHGATDAPTVDVMVRGNGVLVNNAAYGDMTGYLSVPAANYTLDVTPGNDNNTIVAYYQADLSTLGGGAAVVFASGFLTPSTNQNGAAFGLYAALPNGTVIALPQAAAPTARLQVIHNAADPAASLVDIYVNGSLFLDNFAFRAATPFVTVPAGVQLSIGVAPGNSTGPGDIIASIPVTLGAAKTYVAVANGVLSPPSFASNPDSRSTAFTLFVTDMGREAGNSLSSVDLNVLHGSTDAPTVDVIARGVGTIVNNAAYGDFTGYLSVPAGRYVLDITPGSNSSVIVASYVADISSLGGGAAVVFASGFLAPASNQNGPRFGLFAALANGTVIQLPVNAPLDILPGGCPNPFNLRARGALPVALAGSSWFNVTSVDASTVRLNGVAPNGNPSPGNVTAPFPGVPANCGDCYSGSADGMTDWTFLFDRQSIRSTLGMVSNNACVVVTVTGQLNDGTPFVGTDVLRILGAGNPKADGGMSELDVSLAQNAPNPVVSGTTFQYSLPEESYVTLEIFNALGQRVASVFNGVRAAGSYSASWNGIGDNGVSLQPGSYIYRLKAGEQVLSRMLVITR